MTLYLGKQQVAMTMNHVDESAVAQKVDKVTTPNIVYGTDSNGDQTTYDKNSFGQVDDVQVNGTSVVNNKVASITLGTMASENTTSYYTKTEVNGKLDDKQDTLVSGTNIKTVNGNSLLGSGNLDIDDLSNNITNCITEIPQDIKLELNNGTLTLKAGSKVYVPNGFESDGTTRKFDAVMIASDKTNALTDNGTYFAVLSQDGSFIGQILTNDVLSGSLPAEYTGWIYNTSDNIIAFYNNGIIYSSQFSLPFARFTVSGGAITSIDQVFNGFGYIGSTVFALPGVKGLIPNGRNEDGSLKNIEITISSVITRTVTEIQNTHEFTLLQSAIGLNDHIYNNEENHLYNASGQLQIDRFVAGKVDFSSTSPYKVVSFQPKTAFHALDYNDSSTISGWSMPSDRYIDLTLGASGATYTAPANGYFVLQKQSTASNQAIAIYTLATDTHTRTGYRIYSNASGQYLLASLPVKKGESVTVTYGGTSTTGQYFRFVYAEGDQ